jgi:superfamily II DNA or RNA helicase
MSEVQLSGAFFQKTAGWEAVQQARALLAAGKVLSSNWSPPVLKGVVQAGETTYRAGLVIRGPVDIDNLCTCRRSREDGILCHHSVAVGLHQVEGGKAPPTPSPGPAGPTGSTKPGPGTAAAVRPAIRLRRAPGGEPLSLQILLPPNLFEAALRGKVMVMFEGVWKRGRTPLNSLVALGPFALEPADEAALAAAEELTGGDTPGMCQLSTADLCRLLPALVDHPRITLGRNQQVRVSTQPASLPITATLEPTGEIEVRLRPGSAPQGLLAGPDGLWIAGGNQLQPLALPASLRALLQGPVRLGRPQVPDFLARDWPMLDAATVTANFRPEDFEFSPAPPRFLLNLAGGMAQLFGTLQCQYGARIMTVGVTAPGESSWLPDPNHPRRYSTRDLSSEHRAFQRLRSAGFTGPDAKGQWQLLGQERVLTFFSREYPRMEKEWTVTLEERLEHSTRKNLDRIEPRFQITPSGEQWFDLDVSFESASGERFSAADIQQLLRGGGGRRLRNGRFAVLDTDAIGEFQETLLDCAPTQQGGTERVRYRISQQQAGFLEGTLREQGLTVQAPPSWQDRVRRQQGALERTCPPLGTLDEVLRPYQKQGVAWLAFLRSNGFGGVLADEMGLGKTLQVLAHLAAASRTKGSPSLVVCPTSLVFNWAAEATRWTPQLRVLALHGSDRHDRFGGMPDSDLVITSYALLRRDLDLYREVSFDTVILDEAQHIKNRQTQNAQAVKSIRAAHRLVLTGTPLENSVLDLWSLYDFLMPGYLGTANDFRERYEVPIVRERDAGSMQRLARRIRPFLLRRMKKEVVKDLPGKLEQVAYCELGREQAEVYQQILSQTRREVADAGAEGASPKNRLLVLTALLRLRQVCCDLRLLNVQGNQGDGTAIDDTDAGVGAKVQLFSELLDEIVDGGHRALVFSQFTSMLDLLRAELDARELPYCHLDGSTKDRGAVVERFQKDASIPVFLISLKAGGVGLNLTGADTVIHFDPWWNPAVEDQATDRAHRIGQTRVVTSYKLIARGTVEEKILTLQRRKRELLSATLADEAAFTEKLTWEDIQELLS